ncbi:MAG TPA: CoB--CoM heterodisulfide reductase iron-sulfur subunit B family protein [Phycisphaerae bacterium]|nr:CoB--CoM heterodisulfide reductase iron-sulfur subunit B family protein [Phycisphaerae bacterium]
MTTIGYYPGCSLHGTGRELDMSIKALAEVAGVELKELEDWNCCGASAAHSLNHNLAIALPYRNLALAEEQGLTEVLAPCAACFSRLKGTTVRLGRSDALLEKMRGITEREFKGSVTILSIIEFVGRLLDEGLREKLTSPLEGLKVAPYYGCLLARGEDIVEGYDAEQPTGMDAALVAAGCEVVPWNFAVECCGGGFSMSMTDAVVDLSNAILTDAEQAGARAIVTGCPMCHSNLDMRQRTINEAGLGPHDLPIVYLSEILGLAAGVEPERLGLDRHFVDAMRVAERSA